MPTSNEVRAALGTPEILKLKAIGKGLVVDKVCGDRLLVEAVEPETLGTKLQREGLLVMPETAAERSKPKPSTGIIIQVGEGVDDADRRIYAEGVMVLFSKYSGTDVIIDEREGLKVLECREVMATLAMTDAGMIIPEGKAA